MIAALRPAIVLVALFTILCGVAYPLAVTAGAQLALPRQANGSLVERGGVVVGSRLIGQHSSDDRHFWSRPSATGPAPTNALASSGSNRGPTNPALVGDVRARIADLRKADAAAGIDAAATLPADLVTTSASGLDPHLSPAAMHAQVPRVARARGLADSKVQALVDEHVEPRTLGLWGEPRVNVLELNLALDANGSVVPP